MTERFAPADTVASAYLDESAPLGLFCAVNAGVKTTFWVVEHEGARHAILLEAERAEPFQVWSLNSAETYWRGLALGAVHLEVDVNSAELAAHGMREAGDVTSHVNGVMIHVQVPKQFGLSQICISKSLPGPKDAPGAHFRNWRLVQRPDKKPLVVLFERRKEAR